ncbi:MAG TPA: hypothetical protein VMU61_05135 [Candidatus Aquilonibacter sp.]|nr:hypothetical protein [Candidatus Aquilonibacter sp.]
MAVSGMTRELKAAMRKLVDYCRAENWSGYDPYDALNSRLLESLPLLNSRIPRIALTQLLKRSPINVRRVALVPKTQNPKALALFLSAFLQFSESDLPDREELIRFMVDRLFALRSPGVSHSCWGYSFPWQGRKVVVPKGAPNLVCTTFVAGALLDAYEQRGEPQCLAAAVSAAEYLHDELYWTAKGAAGFSYPLPSLRNQIHNANFLAAALLVRVYKHTRREQFLEPALKAARYSAAQQREDGSWFYGDGASQQWIDNFHTGYNLCALRAVARDLATSEFNDSIRRGFQFYRDHFFREDGAPRYFHNRTYPIDIHCVAQSILTLVALQDLDSGNEALADGVAGWAMKHLWDERGFFYYRVLRTSTIRTSYMRWSQAWMLLALAALLREHIFREERTQEAAGLVQA